MSATYYFVRANRIQCCMSCTISYVYVRYRMLTYNIVSELGHCMLITTSYINILCRMFDVHHRMSVLKAPSIDLIFSKDPRPRRMHMASVFARPCTPF